MERENGEPNSKSYRSLIKRKWLVLAGVPALAIAATLVYSSLQSPTYVAEAQLQVLSRDSDSLFKTGLSEDDSATAEQLQEAIQDLEGDEVRARIAARLDPGIAPPEAQVSRVGATDVLAVRVQARNPRGAADVANAYVDALADQRRDVAVDELTSQIFPLEVQIDELDESIATLDRDDPERKTLEEQRDALQQELANRQIDAELAIGRVSLVQSAVPPERPTSPGPIRSAALIGAVAFLVALGVERARDDFESAMSF